MTGSTAGIGRAIAIEFARQGASVVVTGRDPERGAEVVDAVEALGGRCARSSRRTSATKAACTDLVAAAVDAARRPHRAREQRGGRVADRDGRAGDLATDAWEAILRVDLTAPIWLCACRAARTSSAPATARSSTSRPGRPSGRRPGFAAYIAAKGGLNALTAIDRGRLRRGRHPLQHDQPGLRAQRPPRRGHDCRATRSRARGHAPHPARRGGRRRATPRCTSRARESEFVTGINLQLDGGSSIARGAHLGMSARCTRASRQRDLARSPARSTTTSRSGPRTAIDQRRRLGREARSARLGRRRAAPACGRRRAARRQPHRPRTVPPRARRSGGPSNRNGSSAPIDAARRVRRRVPGVHDRTGRRRCRGRRRPTRSSARWRRCSPRRTRRGRAVRDRAHQLAAGRRRLRPHAARTRSTSPAASTPACAWRSTRAGPSAASTATIADGVDRIRLVQVSDFARRHALDARTGSYPATATSRSRASSARSLAAGYPGCVRPRADRPAHRSRGLRPRGPRAVRALDDMLNELDA